MYVQREVKIYCIVTVKGMKEDSISVVYSLVDKVEFLKKDFNLIS